MAKKQTTRKTRKSTKAPAKRNTRVTRAPRTVAPAADASALSVTDGEMKSVIRSAFLRRET